MPVAMAASRRASLVDARDRLRKLAPAGERPAGVEALGKNNNLALRIGSTVDHVFSAMEVCIHLATLDKQI